MDRTWCFVAHPLASQVVSFYAEVLDAARAAEGIRGTLVTLTARQLGVDRNVFDECYSLENCLADDPIDIDQAVKYLNSQYPGMNWSQLVASERAFNDYSMLLGAGGERQETIAYVVSLVCRSVLLLESAMKHASVVVCQPPDTLLSLIAINVAKAMGLQVAVTSPAWIVPGNREGGFIANDEFLHSARMEHRFQALVRRGLSEDDLIRASQIQSRLVNYNGSSLISQQAPGAVVGHSSLSPNLRRPAKYLSSILAMDKRTEYTRPSIPAKIRANVLRLIRKRLTSRLLETIPLDNIPERSILLPLHFQPEQSTLAQGIWFTNQIALIETVSKAIPLGWTLVVKEHPWGRGSRPQWQYRYLQRLYNVEFSDANSHEILDRVQMAITVSGTIALEAAAHGVPAIMFGGNFFDSIPSISRCTDVQELPNVIRKALSQIPLGPADSEARAAFFAAYSHELIPAFPLPGRGAAWAAALLDWMNWATSVHEPESLSDGE